jgi:hypothetical protein
MAAVSLTTVTAAVLLGGVLTVGAPTVLLAPLVVMGVFALATRPVLRRIAGRDEQHMAERHGMPTTHDATYEPVEQPRDRRL